MCAVTSISTAGASPLVRIKQFCCRQPWTCIAIAAIAAVGVLFALKVLPLTFCLATCLAASAVVALIAVAVWKIFRTNQATESRAQSGTTSGPAVKQTADLRPNFDIVHQTSKGYFQLKLNDDLLKGINREFQSTKPPIKTGELYIPKGQKGVSRTPDHGLDQKITGTITKVVSSDYVVDQIGRFVAEEYTFRLGGGKRTLIDQRNNLAVIDQVDRWVKVQYPGRPEVATCILYHLSQQPIHLLLGSLMTQLISNAVSSNYHGTRAGERSIRIYIEKQEECLHFRLFCEQEIEKLASIQTIHSMKLEVTREGGYRGVGEIQIEKIEGRFKPDYLAHLQRAAQE